MLPEKLADAYCFQAAAKTGPVPAPRAWRETREAPWSVKVEEVQPKVQLVETLWIRLKGGECRSCRDRYICSTPVELLRSLICMNHPSSSRLNFSLLQLR